MRDRKDEALAIPAGTRVLIGAPAHPFPYISTEAVSRIVALSDGIREAHLPLVQAVGLMPEPRHVLVIVPSRLEDSDRVVTTVGASLSTALGHGQHLDIWILSADDPLLAQVRQAGCLLWEAGLPPLR